MTFVGPVREQIAGQTAAPKSGEIRESRVKLEICPPGTEVTDWQESSNDVQLREALD